MKRCPKCRRDYFDDSLLYCLDDGTALLEGPATDEPPTAVLPSEAPTRVQFPEASDRAAKQTDTSTQESQDSRPHKARPLVRPLFIAAAAIVLVVGGFFGYRYLVSEAKHVESIAVMPFENQSGNPDVEFVCDGMTEALISSLSRLPNVSVKARNSVFRYKGREVTPTVASELGVQAVLIGRITSAGDRFSLLLELIEPSTETNLWSERYDRKLSELASLQSEISRDVSTRLREKLSGSEIERLERQPTTSSEAYQLYLRGRFEWNKRQKEPLLRAVDHFKQAIVLDPSFALAHAGLADCYIVFNTYEVGPPSEAYPLARAAVQKALELDPEMAEAHTSLAAINEDFDWDYAAAERNYRRSIELAPNNASSHQWFGEFLRVVGRFDEAVAEGKRSVELDPVSLPANNSLGITLFYANRCDEAIAQQKKTLELDPNYPWAHARMADCYTIKGMYNEAITQYRKAIELTNEGTGAGWVLAHYGHALGVSGNSSEARKVAQRLRERQRTEFIEGDNLAIVYYGLGDLHATFAELERGYKERAPGVRYIKTDPRFGGDFRSDPRYKELIRKIGLE